MVLCGPVLWSKEHICHLKICSNTKCVEQGILNVLPTSKLHYLGYHHEVKGSLETIHESRRNPSLKVTIIIYQRDNWSTGEK